MALDARHRTSIYQKLVPLLGDDDTNALMSEFPSVETDELVTKQFLRSELAELRGDLRGEIAGLRVEMERKFNRQTVWLGGLLVAGFSLLGIFR